MGGLCINLSLMFGKGANIKQSSQMANIFFMLWSNKQFNISKNNTNLQGP